MGGMTFQFPGFAPEARQFLRDLRDNNRRDWFNPRKPDYLRNVREPLLELVEELGESLAEYAPGHLQDPRKSVYRVYRDIRFSKNKQPYKTHAAALFPPVGGGRHSRAGFYFHFDPEHLLVGGGLYAPGKHELMAVRQQLAVTPEEFRAILSDPAFTEFFPGLQGERLKRTPKGFRKDHPASDLLVYKQFLSGAKVSADEIEKPSITGLIDRHFRALAPFIAYLNRPLTTDWNG